MSSALCFQADPSAVPSSLLGGVQGPVGPTEDRAAVIIRQSLGHARAEGARQFEFALPQDRRREAVPDAVDDAHGMVEPNLRQQQQEFLSASPAQVILCPHPCPAGPREMLEDGIARFVPMRVVDGLEVVDVDHGNAQAGSRILVGSERLIEQAEDMAAVRQPRELDRSVTP